MDGNADWPHQRHGYLSAHHGHDVSDMIDYTDIYVDDTVVYSESLNDHLVHLRKVLQASRLREHQVFVKLKKCSFAQSEI